MVAFVIAALAVAVLIRGTTEGLTAARVAIRYEEALSRARSRLTAICRGALPDSGNLSGDDGGGFRWKVALTPRGTTGVAGAAASDPATPPLRLTLYLVDVEESWRAGDSERRVALQSECVAQAPTEAP